jgi:hypothetical protein
VEICHLYISSGHNFVGHHGREPDTHPMIEVPMLECVAGRGIRGDRYFDFKDDYKGQITFFSLDVFDELCAALEIRDCSPAAARRNVITRGFDLNELIGREFEVQGGRFLGMEESRPARKDSLRRHAPLDRTINRGGRRALCSRLSLQKGEGRVRVCCTSRRE